MKPTAKLVVGQGGETKEYELKLVKQGRYLKFGLGKYGDFNASHCEVFVVAYVRKSE